MAAVTKEQTAIVSSASTPEEEALKRNTDCVYFLASPLTCKKGAECEYRHSEYARINPRDCWYWLNGNCLNPKCAFRHPPLDTLMSPQTGNFSAPSLPVPPTPAAPVVPSTPQGAPKQAVPCIFFQKGYCLKGDRCPFLHGPNPVGTKVQQAPTTAPVAEPSGFKKPFGGLEKCSTQTKANLQANVSKVVEAPPQAKPVTKVEVALSRVGIPAGKRGPSPGELIEPLHYRETVGPIDNGNSRSRTSHAHRASSLDDLGFQNGRDADDGLRESSPGFDVLVDDKLRGDEYYQHEDQYGRMRGHEGSVNEYEMGHPDDYNSVADVDREMYHNRRGYDSYDRMQERHAWDQHRASSERSLPEPGHYDRRDPYKSKSPDFIQNSDLRHRLSNKQRRVNGLKSVVNPDHNPEKHPEDRGYRSSRRESRSSPVHESSRSSRLQGRIKLPRRPSPPTERESERGRNWGRLSPSRPQVSSQQGGRLRDRLNIRTQDERNEGRSLRGPGMIRRDSSRDSGTNFAAPKSLAELKGSKQTDVKQQSKPQQPVSGGKLRDTVLASSVGFESDLSFDGPKPLSEILKRKRDGGGPTSTTGRNNEEKNNKHSVNTEDPISTNPNSREAPKQEQDDVEDNNKHFEEEEEEEGEVSNKKMKLTEEEEYPVPENKEEPYREEEGLVAAAEGEEEQGLEEEEYEQEGVEYEYEQDEGEGYNLNEGETADHDDEFMDEDDGDDFAKTLGVSI